jgi:hypothetical protein
MGFWGSLLNGIADVGASLIPGGSLAKDAVKAGLEASGAIAGGMSKAGAQNTSAQNANNFSADQLRLAGQGQNENAQEARAQLELQQQAADRTAQSDAYTKALRSALALHQGDVSLNRPQGVSNVSFSGSPRPSMLGPEGHEAAALLNNQALQSLMNGPKHTALAPLAPAFQPTPIKGVGLGTNILGATGLGLSAIGAAMPGGPRGSGDPNASGIVSNAIDMTGIGALPSRPLSLAMVPNYMNPYTPADDEGDGQ